MGEHIHSAQFKSLLRQVAVIRAPVRPDVAPCTGGISGGLDSREENTCPAADLGGRPAAAGQCLTKLKLVPPWTKSLWTTHIALDMQMCLAALNSNRLVDAQLHRNRDG
eukprot:jgi/Ulvmu1/5328/UM022_0122.1